MEMNTRFALVLACVISVLGFRSTLAQNAPGKAPSPSNRGGVIASLDADERLAVRVSVNRKSETVAKTLELLGKITKVKCFTADTEIAGRIISYHYQATPLRDIFYSLAAVQSWRWKPGQNGTWQLCQSSHEHDNLRPHSDNQAELFRLGHDFLKQFGDLPPDVQHTMFHDNSQPGVPGGAVRLDSLPQAMQDTINAMIEPSLAFQKEMIGTPALINPKEQTGLTLSLQGQHNGEYDTYHINIGKSGVFGMMLSSFPVFHDAGEDYHVVPNSTEPNQRPWQPEKDDLVSRREAMKNDARMQTKVSVNVEDATLSQVMQYIAPLGKIDYVLMEHGGNSIRKTFRFVNQPLGNVLDQLCLLYDYKLAGLSYGYCWGKHGAGTIVFHTAPVQALASYRATIIKQ